MSLWCHLLVVTCLAVRGARTEESPTEEPPEGYYAFVQSPNATPPRVRPPPYRVSGAPCGGSGQPRVAADNLCGDLNRGEVPANPLGHFPGQEPYPFELIRNQTLKFLSRTLPVLRADDTLPRVAHLAPTDNHISEPAPSRDRRAVTRDREARDTKFCDGGGVFCMLYKAINGESSGAERREDPGVSPAPSPARYEGPPTPCPARVEYATPVFARNYQGVWRYVVQIPYEGYFTQTVEVTRCLRARCHYLDGGCLSSPRWLELLVAELHYSEREPAGELAGELPASTTAPAHCDGHDALGCFQVRLYYDWFLVPGSCKCWRPDYFARYVRRNNEL